MIVGVPVEPVTEVEVPVVLVADTGESEDPVEQTRDFATSGEEAARHQSLRSRRIPRRTEKGTSSDME